MVPVPGGKLIRELFGRASSDSDLFSLAHMVAPGGWSEPPQTPQFDEITVVVRGRVRVDVDGESIELTAGQAIWTESGTRVHYANPFDDEAEYLAICIPAFTVERAGRDPE